ncbi:unnamed protein product [Urochloa humidicola]
MEHDAGEEEMMAGLEPLFYDEAEAVAEHERRTRREQEKARREEHERARRERRWKAHNAAIDRLRDYDPKQGGEYYTRYSFADMSEFDLDEESPLGPMRFTDRVYKPGDYWELCEAFNFLTVKIVSSDVGFPIDVYGTVIARDSIDHKCVYLFRRDRDHSQLINSKEESLILTGPKRGIISLDDTYVEIDLKIKDDGDHNDRELSKGYVSIRGARQATKKYELESRSLDTRLSTVEVIYGVVGGAVEATIAVEVVQGEFYGQITASPASIQNNSLVLHDSQVAGVLTGDANKGGIVQLSRPVVAVCLKDTLSVTVIARAGGAETECSIGFAPRINGREVSEISLGEIKMLVKVNWSLIYP